MVMTSSSSLTRVSQLIAKINSEPENTVRQRLKEWYKEEFIPQYKVDALLPFQGEQGAKNITQE